MEIKNVISQKMLYFPVMRYFAFSRVIFSPMRQNHFFEAPFALVFKSLNL